MSCFFRLYIDMVKHRSIDTRELAIRHMRKGNTQKETSNIFDVSIRTLQRWQLNDIQERKVRDCSSYKIKEKHVKYALLYLELHPSSPMLVIHQALKKKYRDYNITAKHLGRVIRDQNITRKRTTVRHFPET